MNKRRIILFLSAAVLVIFSVVPTWAQDRDLDKMAVDVLYYVNKHRTDMGLGELKMNDVIIKEALGHSRNMAYKRVPFGHDGFDERMGRILKQLAPANAAAENVAEGSKTAQEVVNLWLHSPGHRKNIEGDYNTTGIGIVPASDGTLYYTQIFIHKK